MSPRARVLALVVTAAALAIAAVVGGALLQDDDGSAQAPAPPPLDLGIFPSTGESRALIAAERDYERGDRASARAGFERILRSNPDSIEAAVGAALAAWPDGSVERLRELVAEHPGSGVARLHHGLALNALGDEDAAVREWREAEARDPDSPAAVQAETLLHPTMAPGRPFFIPAEVPPPGVQKLGPAEQLAALRERAAAGDVGDLLVLGAFLQRIGRPVSARAAYDRAVTRSPEDLEARTAAAVARFDKDDPAQAFSRLGPLTRSHPRAAVVRYHLGLMLLWLRAVDEAARQLRLATRAEPDSFYARQAENLLSRLPKN